MRKLFKRVEWVNEFTILAEGYISFLFTDFVPDAGLRYKIGFVFIIILILNLIYNWICFLIIPSFKKLFILIKKKCRATKAKKYIDI